MEGHSFLFIKFDFFFRNFHAEYKEKKEVFFVDLADFIMNIQYNEAKEEFLI